MKNLNRVLALVTLAAAMLSAMPGAAHARVLVDLLWWIRR